MKAFVISALVVVSSISYGRIVVEECRVDQDGISIQVVARANQYMVAKSSAMMESKMDGRTFVSTQDQATYQFFSGTGGARRIQSHNFLRWMANEAEATKADLAKGVSVYYYGTPEDDGAGVVLMVFQSLRGKRTSYVYHGWAGIWKCQ